MVERISSPMNAARSAHSRKSLALEQAVERAEEIVFLTDREGILQYVNPAFVETYGFHPEEVIGKCTPNVLRSGEMEDAIYTELWTTIQAGRIFCGDFLNKTRTGKVLNIKTSVNPIMNNEGTIEGFLAIQRDVTLEREEHTKLVASEERFRMVVQNIDDVVFTLDKECRHTGIHGSWLSTTGQDENHFLGRTAVDIFGAEAGQIHIDSAIAAMRGKTQRYEWSVDLEDGPRYFETVLSPLYGGNGSAKGVVGLGRDVTASRTISRELKRSGDEYRDLYELSPVSLVSVSRDARIVKFNRRAVEVFKIPTSEALGQPISMFYSENPDQRRRAMELFERAMRGEVIRNEEVAVQSPYAGPLWLSVSLTPQFDPKGQVIEARLAILDITQQRRAREEAEKSQQAEVRMAHRLESILDTVSEGIYGIDKDGCCTFINGAGQKILGWNEPDILGKDAHDILHSKHLTGSVNPPDGCPMLTSLKTGKPSGIVRDTLWRRDGRPVSVEFSSNPLLENGAVVGAVVSFRDISGRLRDERKMQEAIEQHRGLMQAGTDAIIIADAESGLILELNQQAESLLAADRVTVVGRQIQEFFPDHDSRTRVLTAGMQAEARLLPTNGISVPVEVSTTIIDVQGSRILQAVVRDIRERKHMQAELEERTRYFEQLFESSPVAIALLDTTGSIRKINGSFRTIFGWSEEECVGKEPRDLIVPQGRAAEATDLLLQRDRGEVIQLETVRKNRQGESVDVLMLAFPITIEGKHAGAYLMYSDLRQQKLMERQMLRSQRMESIGVLAGGIAHDLNNVLGPILLSVDFLGSRVKDDEARKIIDAISISAQRGAGIVKQILSFARGVEGERVPMSLKHVFNEMRDLISQTFPKSIQLSVSVQQDLWMVKAEATHLHQVLLNLCVNARDAMPGGGQISVTADNIDVDASFAAMHPGMKEGMYVRLNVSDTGVGISAEIREKIFDPFFTTKEVGKGTGLGLSTVAGIVKTYGGIIDLVSTRGDGSTFSLYLPADKGAVLEQTESISSSLAGKGETILIVDDEESILQVMSRTIEAHGYRALTAKDGVEAVSIAAEHKTEIKVAVVDSMMPVMDGATTTRALRRVVKGIPVIVISGVELEPHTFGEDNPVQGILQKPFTAATLLTELKQVLACQPGLAAAS